MGVINRSKQRWPVKQCPSGAAIIIPYTISSRDSSPSKVEPSCLSIVQDAINEWNMAEELILQMVDCDEYQRMFQKRPSRSMIFQIGTTVTSSSRDDEVIIVWPFHSCADVMRAIGHSIGLADELERPISLSLERVGGFDAKSIMCQFFPITTLSQGDIQAVHKLYSQDFDNHERFQSRIGIVTARINWHGIRRSLLCRLCYWLKQVLACIYLFVCLSVLFSLFIFKSRRYKSPESFSAFGIWATRRLSKLFTSLGQLSNRPTTFDPKGYYPLWLGESKAKMAQHLKGRVNAVIIAHLQLMCFTLCVTRLVVSVQWSSNPRAVHAGLSLQLEWLKGDILLRQVHYRN